MDIFVVVALVGVALFLTELLLLTGDESTVADIAGPALITLGVLSAITFFVVGRKVLAAHVDNPVWTGQEELVGRRAEVRTALDPEGQVWIEGALWRARLGDGTAALRPGDRVVVESVDGLTLMVAPEPRSEEGAG
jgi:membrane-bound serine protease (ClpP class)